MPGMRQSMKTTSYGSDASYCRTAAMASAPDATTSTREAMPRSASIMISRAAALSSTTSTRRRESSSGRSLRRAPAEASASHTVKWKEVPAPTSLTRPICPPMSSTSRFEMVSPRPVPPCLRVVDASACVNGWKRRALCSRDIPMPVSSTENRSFTFSPVRSSSATRTRTSPRSVNFTALFTRFVTICPSRSGSPTRCDGTSGATRTRSSRPLSCAF